MHPFFEPLSDPETMLLLTTLTVGGSASTQIFEGLPPDSRTRLQEKARALLDIPSDKRVPFMIHHMKAALTTSGGRGLERIDPSWIVQALEGDSPRVVACILVSLPPPIVRAVLKQLPQNVRRQLPHRREVESVAPDVIRAVREIFEHRFEAMPKPTLSGFSFRDIVQLDRTDLLVVLRALGLVELGQAFVSVGPMALAEFCRRLPRERAEELILAVRSASHADLPDLKVAQRLLARVLVDFEDTEEFFQKSGLWRCSRASLPETDAFVAGMRQRLPRALGTLYADYVQKNREAEALDPSLLQRLQDSVLIRILRLAREQRIDTRWGAVKMNFVDPSAAKTALEGPTEVAALSGLERHKPGKTSVSE